MLIGKSTNWLDNYFTKNKKHLKKIFTNPFDKQKFSTTDDCILTVFSSQLTQFFIKYGVHLVINSFALKKSSLDARSCTYSFGFCKVYFGLMGNKRTNYAAKNVLRLQNLTNILIYFSESSYILTKLTNSLGRS